MKQILAVARRPRNMHSRIQLLLLFLGGVGFLVHGLLSYRAYVAVGLLFLLIAYRGITCATDHSGERD